MGQDLAADQQLESATQREPALSDNLLPEEQAQSHSDLPREPASRPELLHQQQQQLHYPQYQPSAQESSQRDGSASLPGGGY